MAKILLIDRRVLLTLLPTALALGSYAATHTVNAQAHPPITPQAGPRPRPQPQPHPQPQRPPTLSATITLSATRVRSVDQLRATVQLSNAGTQLVVIPAQMLATAILLLEVRNARGERMNTIPPSVPNGETVSFAPGASRTVQLQLNMFSPTLPPGTYTVQPRGAVIQGTPVQFIVGR